MRTIITTISVLSLSLPILTFPLAANPIGGSVVGGNGNATINGQGTTFTTINQSANRVIINWQDFSIGLGEVTKFVQPSANSVALNRVFSGNPSEIYGSLQANGRVFVVNPNGIMVGAHGQIDTKGFVGSTLKLANSSFLAGANLTLSGNSTAAIHNEGTIQALGGDVFLIAHNVENAGTIRAPQGTVGLAAGSQVRLVQSGNERISVQVGQSPGAPPSLAAATGVNNLGTVEAASAELKAAGGNIYALAINNGGVVRADGAARENGRIVLKASGGNIQNSGTLSANNRNGSGGTIVLDGGHNTTMPATVINSGNIEARGDASATKGGQVSLLGDHVGLFGNALVDVSGYAGGGTALIGGDYQGNNPAVRNADATFLGANSRIEANALTLGNGGKVIVWANEMTRVYGSIAAHGRGVGASGGLVETSSKNSLDLLGAFVDAGLGGRWLLDPRDLTVDHAPPAIDPADVDVTGTDPRVFTAVVNNAKVERDSIETALNLGTSVTLSTGNTGTQQGDITVSASITKSGGTIATLTLDAADDIIISAPISGSATHPLNVVLDANLTSGSGSVTLNNAITTLGGAFNSSAITFSQNAGGTVTTAGGLLSIAADNMAISQALNAGAGRVTLQTLTGGRTITLGGSAGGTLSLSDGELDLITAGTLQIGNVDSLAGAVSGPINITDDISPALTTTLSLHSGSTISESATKIITVPNLALRAAGDVDLQQPNLVTTLAASISGSGHTFSYNDLNSIALGAVDSLNGVVNNSGNVNITAGAGGNITSETVDNIADVIGQIVSLTTSGAGLIGVSAALPLEVHATTKVNATTVNSDIFLKDPGDLIVGDINAGLLPGNVNLQAGGNIFDDGVNSTVIRANALTMTAGNSIGAAGANNEIDTDISTLTLVQANNGSVYLREQDTLSLNGLTVTAATAAGAGNDVVISTAQGDLTVGSISAPHAATLTATVGSIKDDGNAATKITAPAVSLTAGKSIGAPGAGNEITTDTTSLTLNLGGGLLGGDLNVSSASDLATLDLTAAQLGKNNTYVVTAPNLTFNVTDAGTSFLVTEVTDTTGLNFGLHGDEDIIVAKIDVGNGQVSLSSSAGSILDDGNNATLIHAGSLSMTAANAIGAAGANNEIDTDITTLTLAQANNGSVFVGEQDTTTANGLVVVAATATGAGNDVVISTAQGDLTVGSITAPDTVTLTATLGAIKDDANNATVIRANSLSMTAGTAIGAAGANNEIDTDITTLTLAQANNGSVFVGEQDTLSANGLTVIAATATGAGNDVVITTAQGDLTIGLITAPDAVTLTATTGAIKDDANNATVIRANSLSMTAGTAIGAAGANNEIDTDITTLTLAQANNGSVFLGEQDTISANGLAVTAATATGAGNDVVISTALGDLTVGSITAPHAVTLIATAGAIKDDANNATVIRANSLSMTAGTAIGATGPNNEIDTDITTLTLAQANNGSIFLREQDTTTADGLVVSAATATGAGNDIVISTAQGDLTVGSITAPDTVLLTANLGAIKDDGNNATVITADAAGLQAQTGINGLRTALKKIEAQTVTGGISLNNSGNLDIGGVSGTLAGVRVITSGGIQLVNDGAVSIKLPGENVVAPGDVSIVANGATSDIVTGGSDGFPFGAVRSTAGASTLNAGRDILVGSAGFGFGNIEGGGSVSLTAGRDVIVDQFSGIDAHGVGTLTISAGRNVSLVNFASISTEGGTLSISTGPGGLFSSAPGAGVISTHFFAGVGGDMVITADDIAIGTPIDAGVGTVTLQNVFAGREIVLGTDVPGTLSLTQTELNFITSPLLHIGRNDASASGNITITAPITSPSLTLHLFTGGAVVDGNAVGVDITAQNLAISAATGIGTSAEPLETAVARFAAVNTTSGDIEIRNSGALEIAAIDGVTGISTPVNAHVTTAAGLNISSSVIAPGDITLEAGNSANPGDNLTISTDVISTGGGTISLIAGDDILQTAGTIQSLGGAVNLVRFTADNEGNAFADGDRGGITQTGGKLLTGSAVFRAFDNVSFTSVDNDVQNIAAQLTGPGSALVYKDANALRVNTVDGLNGITTSDGNVLLDVSALTISQIIKAGAGAVRLVSAGGVNEDLASGTVVAGSLGVRAAGDVTLNQDNNVTIFAANNSGAGNIVEYKDADGVTVGSVSASGSFADTIGITTTGNGNVLLNVGGLTISQGISVGGGTVRIVSAGAVNEDLASGIVTADSLGVRAGGNVTLNQANNVKIFAANNTGSGSVIEYKDVSDVTVGSVSASGSFVDTTGIKTTAGAVTLTANSLELAETIDSGTARTTLQPLTAGLGISLGAEVGGSLSLTDAELDKIFAGGLQIGNSAAGTIDIVSDVSPAHVTSLALINNAAVTESGAGAVIVPQLRISTPGPVTLNANNEIGTLAAALSGSGQKFSFTDVSDLTVGTVDGVAGIKTTDADLNVATLNGSLTADNDVDAGAGAVTLMAGSLSAQNNALTLGAGANVHGLGGITLATANGPLTIGNSAGVDAGAGAIALTAGSLSAQNNALTLGAGATVHGLGGITLTTANGPLTIGNSATVDAGAGAVNLTASSVGNDNPLTIASAANVKGLGGVTLIADNMAINGAVDAGTARATLHPFENGTLIDLGGVDAAGTLGLSDAEIDQITAGTLQIGDVNSGDVTITAAITPAHLLAPSGATLNASSALSIRSSGSITEVGLGSIQVANICLVTDASKLGKTVSLLGQNDFDNVAASGLPINVNDVSDFSTLLAVDACIEAPSIDRGQPAHVPVNSELIRFSGADRTVASSAALAGLSSVIVPTPKLDTTSFSGANVSAEDAAQILPAGAIGTLWLQLPFPPNEEKRYKVEDVSKWTSGRVAAVGSTAGPQSPK